MVEALSSSDNPKHRNSKFLKFLNKLNYGAYKLENETLIKVPEKLKEFRAIETERRNQDMLKEAQKAQVFEESKEELIDTEKSNRFRNILEGNEELTMEKYNELMQEWM
jgi:adenylate kinase